jgi:hypothetical protein
MLLFMLCILADIIAFVYPTQVHFICYFSFDWHETGGMLFGFEQYSPRFIKSSSIAFIACGLNDTHSPAAPNVPPPICDMDIEV